MEKPTLKRHNKRYKEAQFRRFVKNAESHGQQPYYDTINKYVSIEFRKSLSISLLQCKKGWDVFETLTFGDFQEIGQFQFRRFTDAIHYANKLSKQDLANAAEAKAALRRFGHDRHEIARILTKAEGLQSSKGASDPLLQAEIKESSSRGRLVLPFEINSGNYE